MKRPSVLCDSCGEPIARLADGWAQWRRDERGVVTALTLVHHTDRCMYDEATDTWEDRMEDHHAEAFLDVRRVAYLRNLPRYLEGTSVSRVLAKVRALARLDPGLHVPPVGGSTTRRAPAQPAVPSREEGGRQQP